MIARLVGWGALFVVILLVAPAVVDWLAHISAVVDGS